MDNSQRTTSESEECEAEKSREGEANIGGSYMERDAGSSEAASQTGTEDEERTELQTPRRSKRIIRPPERFRT